MRSFSRSTAIAAAAAVACAPAFIFAGTASADSVSIPVLNTSATEAGLCYGTIRGNVDQDSSSGIHLTSAFQGIGTCATTAYVSWHNIDTGARGNTTIKLVGSWYNSATIPSGPGHIELSVTTKEFLHSPDSVQVQYVIPG
ncbi:hypothetical protein OG874_12360 [Nocardia sp. NBC_00565]|uniref:hypothetical protein n=1 Tax=Nocardia sp. NBC_00565 TaxID=2975993 RepID=UPI002E8060BB|nr:hypothetical protein [Nocardia sp. NBC_00565]WUC05876.1 hypothetical protein OG874_12360 [Nocardia sp. NBC_00565]